MNLITVKELIHAELRAAGFINEAEIRNKFAEMFDQQVTPIDNLVLKDDDKSIDWVISSLKGKGPAWDPRKLMSEALKKRKNESPQA